jgi:glycopeptide antibiotics resistance protein
MKGKALMKINVSRQKVEKIIVILCWGLMPIYLFFVIKLTLKGRHYAHRNLILWPLWEYRKLFTSTRKFYWVKQIFNNIIMLLPWGLMLSFINEKVRGVKQIIIAGFGLSFCIEATQFITRRGTFELDDLFNNTLGTLWGFGIYLLVEKLILSRMTSEKKE